MSECNAIIEANNEIDRLKKENEKLNELCVQYGFDMGKLDEENEDLKQVLGNILLEVKRDITNTCQTGEVKAFINPESYNMISNVLRKYSGVHRVGRFKSNERFIVNDNGILMDNVTKEMYNNVFEVADVLNYYEENCLRYQKTISELKDGTYKEPLPITQRK